MSKENKKQELKEKILQYANNGVLDISKFRIENSKLYTAIPYYFGNVDDMLVELGLTKVQTVNKNGKSKLTFRNKLAYDKLIELREKYTLEQIAEMYHVTRALVNQQFQALEISAKIEMIKQEKKQENK